MYIYSSLRPGNQGENKGSNTSKGGEIIKIEISGVGIEISGVEVEYFLYMVGEKLGVKSPPHLPPRGLTSSVWSAPLAFDTAPEIFKVPEMVLCSYESFIIQ